MAKRYSTACESTSAKGIKVVDGLDLGFAGHLGNQVSGGGVCPDDCRYKINKVILVDRTRCSKMRTSTWISSDDSRPDCPSFLRSSVQVSGAKITKTIAHHLEHSLPQIIMARGKHLPKIFTRMKRPSKLSTPDTRKVQHGKRGRCFVPALSGDGLILNAF